MNIHFTKNHDHINHQNSQVSQDAARVRFKAPKNPKTGALCMEGDWIVMNYQLYNDDDGSLIEDTTES